MADIAVQEHLAVQAKAVEQSRKWILLGELKLCRDLQRGKEIHAEARESGTDSWIYLETALVNMYAKCGDMSEARQVFDRMKRRDVVSWTALILGYADNGEGHIALDLFVMMRSQGCRPNAFTSAAVVKACTSLALIHKRAECLELAKQVHSWIGCHSDIYVQNALVNMYAKCGSMTDARKVFDSMKHRDVASWNGLISGYADNGEGVTSLETLTKMKCQGCLPNSFTYVAALKACISLALDQRGRGRAECLKRGKQIHAEVASRADMYVQNTLIDMYVKCGSMDDARQVFDAMKHADVISWTALIMGYAENGQGVTALDVFARMRTQGCAPNSLTFVAALKACSLLGASEYGRKIHAELGSGPELDAILVTSLVDFYAKCGDLMAARSVFDSYPATRDLTTWTALLAGYSLLGDDKAVFELFEGMRNAGLRPNGVTFICVLKCCSHAGLVEKGKECLEAMSAKYGVTPCVEHYTCMVDILGRSNKLNEAIGLLQSMPCRADVVTWMTVLSACRKWKNVEIGRLAFRVLVELDDTNATAYVLMADLCRSRGMWKEHEMVLAMCRLRT